MKPRIVIWGLKSVRHTHRFIHSSFNSNFENLGYEVLWVDDQRRNHDLIRKNDVILGVNVANKHLPIRSDTKYILHNISPEELGLEDNFIQLQVYTLDSSGEGLNNPWIKWNSQMRILFQPWGVPTSKSKWLQPAVSPGKQENWVGSIWNNSENQGNEIEINEFKKSLRNVSLTFKQIGSPNLLRPNGISEMSAARHVNKSPIGAAIVGRWQMTNGYIPCRLFKNIASGAMPVSNGDYSELFGDKDGIFNTNLEFLVEEALSKGMKERSEIVRTAQELLTPYTYEAGIKRIMEFLYSK